MQMKANSGLMYFIWLCLVKRYLAIVTLTMPQSIMLFAGWAWYFCRALNRKAETLVVQTSGIRRQFAPCFGRTGIFVLQCITCFITISLRGGISRSLSLIFQSQFQQAEPFSCTTEQLIARLKSLLQSSYHAARHRLHCCNLQLSYNHTLRP